MSGWVEVKAGTDPLLVHYTPATHSEAKPHILGDEGECWCGPVTHRHADHLVRILHRGLPPVWCACEQEGPRP